MRAAQPASTTSCWRGRRPKACTSQVATGWQRSLTSNECWRSLWLRAYGVESRVAANFPTTMRLLDGSRASSVMFSILAPGCAIDEHRGENKAVLRYHLGVEIPPPTAGRLALYVGGGSPVEVSWEDGADLLFDDTFVHRVENRAAARRVVLFVDVPLPTAR